MNEKENYTFKMVQLIDKAYTRNTKKYNRKILILMIKKYGIETKITGYSALELAYHIKVMDKENPFLSDFEKGFIKNVMGD